LSGLLGRLAGARIFPKKKDSRLPKAFGLAGMTALRFSIAGVIIDLQED
jgi:hypothetical protein